MVRIVATLVKGRDLNEGDLFSTAGPEHWDSFHECPGVGERVYIRTKNPTKPDDMDTDTYHIEIVRAS